MMGLIRWLEHLLPLCYTERSIDTRMPTNLNQSAYLAVEAD